MIEVDLGDGILLDWRICYEKVRVAAVRRRNGGICNVQRDSIEPGYGGCGGWIDVKLEATDSWTKGGPGCYSALVNCMS